MSIQVSTLIYNNITYKVGDILINKSEEYIEILGFGDINGVYYKYVNRSSVLDRLSLSKVFTSIKIMSKYWRHATEKEKKESYIREIIE